MSRDLASNDALDRAAAILWAILQPYEECRSDDGKPITMQEHDFEALLGLHGLMHDAARKAEEE